MALPKICIECHEPAKPGSNRCPAHPPKRSPSSQISGTSAWKKLRAEVLERDGHICQLCGEPATQVDHIVPVSHGGESTLENARAACGSCNLSVRPGYRSVRATPAGSHDTVGHSQPGPGAFYGLLAR